MFVGSQQSLSELTFTDEGAKDNGPSGANTLLSSAAACGGREGGEGSTIGDAAAPIARLRRRTTCNPPTVFKKRCRHI